MSSSRRKGRIEREVKSRFELMIRICRRGGGDEHICCHRKRLLELKSPEKGGSQNFMKEKETYIHVCLYF